MLLLSCAYFVLGVIFVWIHVAKHSSHSHLEQANHVFDKMSHSLLQVQVNFTQTLIAKLILPYIWLPNFIFSCSLMVSNPITNPMSHVAKLVSMSTLTIQKLPMQLLRPKYSLLAVTKWSLLGYVSLFFHKSSK